MDIIGKPWARVLHSATIYPEILLERLLNCYAMGILFYTYYNVIKTVGKAPVKN